MRKLIALLFRCRHGRTTWPRKREERTVRVCLDCGAEVPCEVLNA